MPVKCMLTGTKVRVAALPLLLLPPMLLLLPLSELLSPCPLHILKLPAVQRLESLDLEIIQGGRDRCVEVGMA